LVGALEHEFYFPSYMGCHPNPIDELHDFSRWAHCTTNQSLFKALGFSRGENQADEGAIPGAIFDEELGVLG
jgi:hypothetical protein